MTLTLNLPDELIRQLEEKAKNLNTSVENLAELKLHADISRVPLGQPRIQPDNQFDALSRTVINDHREVLERLA